MNIDKIRALFEASTDKYGDAKKMGITYQSLTNFLRKGGDIRVSTLEGIARFYNVPVGYFFDEAEADGSSMERKTIEKQKKEIERLKGQIKGMQDVADRLGYSLRNFIIEDN